MFILKILFVYVTGDASIYMPEHVCRGQNNSTVNAGLILNTIIILPKLLSLS